MVDFTKDIEATIARFLNGEATPDEAMQLMNWREFSDRNKSTFDEFEKVYSLTHNQDSYSSNTNDFWAKVSEVVDLEDAKVVPVFNYRKAFLAIAAVLVLAIISLAIWRTSFNSSEIKTALKLKDSNVELIDNRVLVATAGVQRFVLDDQSEIKLSNGSSLILSKDFNANDRQLELKGSGEFHVIHDEAKPFILSVNKLDIIDIGTVFKVDTKGDTVKISVSEGAVELRLNDQLISMEEGDSAFYLIKEEVISRYKTVEQREDKTFAFDGTKLKDVASLLSEFFQQPITIRDVEIEDCPLTVTFKNENLITILDIIKELMDVKIVQNNKTIEIYGKGCN